jgi:signal transduction histidine kinase/ligand-binding sensor domain-containing protein/DNA-binding response OmpR family regulator
MPKLLKRISLILLLPVFLFAQNENTSTSTAQSIKFDQITMYDGLSNNTVICILQDSKGFMWFGTRNGLNRYDGNTFKVFKHDPQDSNSISDNRIMALHEDNTGNILIGTYSEGLDIFEPKSEIFTHNRHNSNDPNTLSNNQITQNAIFKDSKSNIWVGTADGLSLLVSSKQGQDKNKCEFVNIKHELDKSSTFHKNVIWTFFEDKNNNMWIGAQDGSISKVVADERKLINVISSNDIFNFLNGGDKNWDPGAAFLIFHDDSDPDYVFTIGSTWNMYRYNFEDNIFIDYNKNLKDIIGNSRGLAYYRNENGSLWVGSNQGLLRIENRKSKIDVYKHNPNRPYSISLAKISTIYKDRQGTLWLGTYGGGINKYDPRKQNFNYQEILLNGEKCSVTAIFKAQWVGREIILLGTASNGLLKYDRIKNKIIQFSSEIGYPINTIYQDVTNNKDIWIGDDGTGLHKFDLKTEKFSGRYIPSHGIDPEVDVQILASANILRDIKGARKNNLWIATHYGLYMFSPDSEKFTPYLYIPDNPNSLSNNHLLTLFNSPENDDPYIWIGTINGGLNKLNTETMQISRYMNDPTNTHSLDGNIVRAICEGEPGFLWLGTNRGLNRFQIEESIFDQVVDKDSKLNIEIFNIFKDNHNNLWLNTAGGLYKYNPATETVRIFDQNDGIPARTLNPSSYYKDKHGKRYFGIYGGFIEFNPDSLITNTNKPKMVLTDFQLFNKSLKPGKDSPVLKSISYTNEIVLSHKQSVFSFEFSALDFSDPEKNNYAYKMEGVDPSWVYTDASRRFATYTNLDAGEYVFRVKGSNNDGIWNEEGTSVKVIILPPWWKTNWAYAVYIFLFGFLIITVWRFQTNRLKMKHELELEHVQSGKLKEVEQMKSQFFTNISHEFRTPLTLIKGPAKLILDQTKDEMIKENAILINRNSEKLSRLVNQLLDISKIEAGEMKLHTSRVNIVSLLREMVLSFADYADRKKIVLNLDSDEEQIFVWLDTDKVEKIVSNIISNAFKYTPENGKITVMVNQNKNTANIKITDTGIGISKDRIPKIFDRFYQADQNHVNVQDGTGIGLALSKELVLLHKGEIEVESEEGEGTTFTITFPLGKSHLNPEEICQNVEEQAIINETIPESVKSEVKNQKGLILDTDLITNESENPVLLVVEDNSDVRQYIRGFLRPEYKIIESPDGEDGYNKSIDQIPDLIVSDVMMPKMDGFALTDKLKNDERTSHIPIILLTAKATSKDKMVGYETGADDYLMKPFDALELKVRIKNLIEQRKKLRQHFQKEGIFNFEDKKIPSLDKKFLEKSVKVINEHLSDTSFGVESFAEELSISRMSLYKKILALVGEPPSDLIKRIRLSSAARLIKNKTGSISEIALEVGFSNPAYFSECFKKQFGILPSKYQ